MATKMGAAGVRTELKDSSQYTVIENPNAIAAIVGFAPKGELNKVTKLNNTAVMDNTFGIGFNNWKYNQGLYAARAVLDAGGFAQYVRPYGEEIDMSDARKRDLKTDCFVVSFDRKAAQQEKGKQNSINIEYFAATRYKSDGASGYGVTRKINNIAETVDSGSNVDFRVFADESFKDSEKARGDGDAVLFAIMGADPSSARRAVTSYEIVAQPDDLQDRNPDTFRVTLAVNPGFIVGDTVYGPADTNTKTLGKFIVSGIDGKEVDVTAADEATHNACMMGYKPTSVLMFSPEDAITDDDADYLTVKTAVTGCGAKLFSSIKLDSDGIKTLAGQWDDAEKNTLNGEFFAVQNQSNETVMVRVANNNFPVMKASEYTIDLDNNRIIVDADKVNKLKYAVLSDDQAILEWQYGGSSGVNALVHSDTFRYASEIVTNEATGEKTEVFFFYAEEPVWFGKADIDPSLFGDITIQNTASGWSDINYSTVALTIPSKGDNETDLAYAGRVRDAILAAFRSNVLGYGSSVVTNDIETDAKDLVSGKTKTFKVAKGSAFDYNVGDIVAIVRGTDSLPDESKVAPDAFDADEKNILWASDKIKVTAINGFTDEVTISKAIDQQFIDTVTEAGTDSSGKPIKVYKPDYRRLQLLNLSTTNKAVYAALPSRTNDIYLTEHVAINGTARTMEIASGEQYKPGDKVAIDMDDGRIETTIYSVNGETNKDDVEYKLSNIYILNGVAPADLNNGHEVKVFPGTELSKVSIDVYLIGNFDVTVNRTIQKTTQPVLIPTKDSNTEGVGLPFMYQAGNMDTTYAWIDGTEKVLRDSDIGANFVGLGLATVRYEDINFTGVTEKVYDLTDEGEAVARLYMSCTYRFNGTVYDFDGTVVEYVHNETQLFIGDAADSEFEGSGLKFILNESGILEAFLEDESWDLSETIVDGIPTSSVTAVSFNTKDPAIVWNAIWSYDPKNNNSTTTLATAYSLFLDKDKADQTFFVAAGNDINNFGWAGRETLNTTVIQAILNICELRKDCFALFDGVAEQNVNNALKKDVVRFAPTLGRWGVMYDARPIFYDSMITRRNVEIAPSVAMASLITANRSGSIFWYVPAGKDTGVVPSAWCTRVKYERKFNIPEDPDSDIARLSDAHVNPFRTNDDGIFCWGDFTMQMEDSAFNQIHVTMLIAGIHKIFYKYLDGKVFRLNTAALRSQISSDLQAKLNMMRDSNPSAFYDAVAICDDTNNTPEVIDQNKLYVDLKLKPTKSTRYIYLRTEVLATSSGNSITISNV